MQCMLYVTVIICHLRIKFDLAEADDDSNVILIFDTIRISVFYLISISKS